MATIGSLSVRFSADVSPLNSGIDEAVSSLGRIGDAVSSLQRQLSGLSANSVSISVDTSGIDAASKSIDDLKAKAESASADVSVSADASGVRELSETVEQAGQAAVQSRSSLASLAVTSAAVVSAARQAARSYADFRGSMLGFIQTTTGAESASAALLASYRGLRGDLGSLRAVFGGVRAGVEGMVQSFASAENVNRLLLGTLGGVMRIFGATDDAVIQSTQVLAGLITQQVSLAASHRAVQRSLQLLGAAYDASTDALARFLTQTSLGRAAGELLSDGLLFVARASVSVDRAIATAQSRITEFLTSGRLMGQVSAAVGTAFDSLAASARGLLGSTGSLDGSFAAIRLRIAVLSEGVARLLPSTTQVRAAFTSLAQATSRLLPPALQVVSAYATITSVLGVASTAMRGFSSSTQSVSQTFSEIAASVGRFAATSVAIGAVSGGLNALRTYATAAGASMTAAGAGGAALTGAMSGAAAAAGGLVTAFPAVAAAVSLAAVASGRFSRQLESLGEKAESIEQMADRFGSSVEQIEKVKTAAANANVSMMALVRSQQNFYSSLSKVKSGQFDSQSVREAKIAFDELGIPVEKLKSLKPEEAFKLVAKSLSDVKNAADRTRIAVDLFGARGAFALPALKEIGEIEEDFNRLGGAIRKVDFGNIMDMEKSFDRLKNAGDALGRTLLVPFVSLQRAFNNFAAELKGGLVAALAPLMTMLNDIAKPIAVVVEAFGRMLNVTLRLIGIFTGIAAFFQVFATVGAIFEGIGNGFRAALAPLEGFIEMFSSAGSEAGIFSAIASGVAVVLNAVGTAIGFVIGAAANLVVGVAAAAAAWGVYTAAVMLANAASITAAISFAAAWAAALGPIAVVVAALAVLGAAVMAVVAVVKIVAGWFYSLGQAIGLVGKEREQIDATAASAKELAAAAREAQDAASWFSDGESESKIAESVDKSRAAFNNLVTESLKYGKAGTDSIMSVQKRYADLEQALATGKISTEEFTKKTTVLFESASKGMKDYEQSAAVTLSKNLELYKKLNDAVRQAEKSVRDLSAGTVVDDKFFPASEEVKSRASQYKAEYEAAIEDIKKKQQSGAFQVELNQKKEQLSADLTSGKITQEQYTSLKMELDSTNAQEQASIAAEEVQREFDRKTAKLKADLSFASEIRKSLETAFLSPVEKFQKELKKIRDNPELTTEEKDKAEKNLRRETRESLIGKTAQTQLQERRRDLGQAVDKGLISREQADFQGKKALDEFAQSLGVVKTPFEDFSASLDGIAEKFGFVGQPIDEVRKKLADTPEQLALFDRAIEESRDKLLASLGIEKSPEKVFQDQMKKIEEAANSSDPSKRITQEQRQQAEEVARRQRDKALGAGDGLGGQFADRQAKINESFGGGKDNARLAVANNALAVERRSAAGLDATPVQKLQAGLAKVNDAFDVTGKTFAEIQANLSAEDFAEYQEAIKKTRDSVLESVGIEKSATQVRAEAQERLRGLALSAGEAAQANSSIADSFMAAIGVTKTPFEQFSSAIDKAAAKFDMSGKSIDEVREALQGNKQDLELFDRAVKEARDSLLQSLGIEKSPEQVFQEQMKKIEEAANSSDPNKRITAEQRQQAETAARRQRDKALGVGDGLGEQFAERQANINEAFGGGKDNARLAIANNALAADKRAAAGLDADPAQQLKAGAAKIDDVFKVTGKSLAEIQATLSPEDFALYQEAQKKNTENIKASIGVEKSGAAQFAEARQKLTKAVTDGVISQDEANKVLKNQKDALLQSLGISKSPSQDFADAVAKIKENASELTPDELQKGLKEAKDKLLQSLGIDKSPADAAEESLKKLREAFNKGQISLDEFNKGTQKAKDALLQSLGIPLDPVVQLGNRLGDLQEAFGKGLITQEEFTRGQEEARRAMLPGGEAESPVKKFERDLDAVDRALQEGLIDPADADQRKKVLQAQLQEDLKPALDRVAPDRRAVESADTRSKAGVDTFFRILRGQDNPGLKAQLETAQATKFLAQAAAQPEAAEVIAQLAAR